MARRSLSLHKKLKYQIPRLRLCLVNESKVSAPPFTVRAPEDIALFLEPLRHQAEECFVAIHLNARHEILGLHEVSHGTLSAALVHPREVFKAALLANSHAILICHNHPSGSPIEPSKEDMETTLILNKSGKLLGVQVLDHVIFSPVYSMYSIRENHPDLWDE